MYYIHVLAHVYTTRARTCGEEKDVVYFKLPGAKKKQKKNKHAIVDAVDNVRGAEKSTS